MAQPRSEQPEPAVTTKAEPKPTRRRRSPLPPPDEFAAYEQAYPGTAERIITMAEADQRAEIRGREYERRVQFIIAIFGQFFLYGLAGCAVYLAINNKPIEAFLAGLAPIAVTIYANSRKRPDDED